MQPILSESLSDSIGKGFSRLASIYDWVVAIFFGHTFQNLQSALLAEINTQGKVLVIGGGTGQVLLPLLSSSKVEKITYIELSEKMLQRSKHRVVKDGHQRVDFKKHLSPNDSNFNLIVLPFVLDCYPSSSITEMLLELKGRMKSDGVIAFIDFNLEPGTAYRPSILKKGFIGILYFFFRSFAHIPARELAPFQSIFLESGFEKSTEYYALKGWVQAIAWHQPKNK